MAGIDGLRCRGTLIILIPWFALKAEIKPGHFSCLILNRARVRQRGILAAIVELELHQRVFETDWRILPVSQQLG